ncbi:hypothetical protein BDD12DRAFT_818466, partial [Trichophaea hybrida]
MGVLSAFSSWCGLILFFIFLFTFFSFVFLGLPGLRKMESETTMITRREQKKRERDRDILGGRGLLGFLLSLAASFLYIYL